MTTVNQHGHTSMDPNAAQAGALQEEHGEPVRNKHEEEAEGSR